jgi:hypothetical protein
MDWVLFIVIASMSADDKAITSQTVPIAMMELCDAARTKVMAA